ncbi:hypothetical protein SK128_002969, partial [Halocaridina rubra]
MKSTNAKFSKVSRYSLSLLPSSNGNAPGEFETERTNRGTERRSERITSEIMMKRDGKENASARLPGSGIGLRRNELMTNANSSVCNASKSKSSLTSPLPKNVDKQQSLYKSSCPLKPYLVQQPRKPLRDDTNQPRIKENIISEKESEKACAPHTVLHKQNLSASQLPTKAKPISQAPRALCPLANYPKVVSKMKENPVEKRGTVLQKVFAGGFAQRNVAGSTLSKAASVRIPAGVATGSVVPKAGASSLARSNSLERVPEVKKREESTGSQHSKSVCENGSVSSSTSHLEKKGHLSHGSSSDKCKKKYASDTRAHFLLLPKENESDRCDPPKNIAVDVVENGASSVKEKTNGVHPNESDNSVTRESDGKKNGHSAKSNSEEVNSKAFPVVSNAQAAVSRQSNKALHEDNVSKVC